ncbi:MAG TPA: hypothetical protein VFE62_24740 [Gemmataceae bacterium]|nr:hypothetical protein [Gemmataceae bacterium]
MSIRAIAVIAMLSVAGPALAQSPAPKADAARIAKLIASLDSAKYAERERATAELLTLEGAVLEPLHKAVASAPTVEFARRAQTILDALAIHEPGGDIVNGLKLRLTVEHASIKLGSTFKLTTHLCNMTAKPLNVRVGYTTCGNYFECGTSLRRLDPASPNGEAQPKLNIGGFCGTGEGPIFVTIPARSMLRFDTVTAAQKAGGRAIFTLGTAKYFNLEGSGADRVRMFLAVTPGENTPRPARPGLKGTGIRPANEDGPYWSGTIRSNEVQIKVAD